MIPALGRERKEDRGFTIILGYIGGQPGLHEILPQKNKWKRKWVGDGSVGKALSVQAGDLTPSTYRKHGELSPSTYSKHGELSPSTHRKLGTVAHTCCSITE